MPGQQRVMEMAQPLRRLYFWDKNKNECIGGTHQWAAGFDFADKRLSVLEPVPLFTS